MFSEIILKDDNYGISIVWVKISLHLVEVFSLVVWRVLNKTCTEGKILLSCAGIKQCRFFETFLCKAAKLLSLLNISFSLPILLVWFSPDFRKSSLGRFAIQIFCQIVSINNFFKNKVNDWMIMIKLLTCKVFVWCGLADTSREFYYFGGAIL